MNLFGNKSTKKNQSFIFQNFGNNSSNLNKKIEKIYIDYKKLKNLVKVR